MDRNKVTTASARSFLPSDWWSRYHGEEADAGYDDNDARPTPKVYTEAMIMWVYRQTLPDQWLVGFYSPDGSWHEDVPYTTREEAAARVRYLNGGN